jgi:hypothetical protein
MSNSMSLKMANLRALDIRGMNLAAHLAVNWKESDACVSLA